MDLILNNITFYVLIVDDNEHDHFLLRKAINKVIPQTIIESLYNGSEALAFLDNCTSLPNLIFLDLNMPLLSGTEAIKVIRKNENLAKIPIIILTSNYSNSKKQEMFKLGANDFYTKPLNPKDLIKIVEAVTDKWLVTNF
jgi:CheY-like chemotaxis protein